MATALAPAPLRGRRAGWPFRRIAIVNRGEPALRLIRAVRELVNEGADLMTVALYTDPDREALFVRLADEAHHIGPPSAYLELDSLARALQETGAEAAWVGWGYVAEQPRFAELCARLGIVFIGPSAAAMRELGDKIKSKLAARAAGVPVGPWSEAPVTAPQAADVAGRIGYPLMVKSAAGGGGRGVRRVIEGAHLESAIASAQAEAAGAFGDGTVFLEAFTARARHVEVQVVCDAHGGAWALGVRDCSIQRRHQKVIEESSSPVLDSNDETFLKEASLRLCRSVGYVGIATVEFLFDPESRRLSFLEVNTRLQVEHPVTEAVTGTDLVKLQLEVAAGWPLPGEPPQARGHAVEVRICAEDPQAGFAPAPGKVELLRLPSGPGIRVDCGVVEGEEIPADFDSMVAKVIAWGRDRPEALSRLKRALAETRLVIRGGMSNRAYAAALLDEPELVSGTADVEWLDRHRPAAAGDLPVALVACALEVEHERHRQEQATFFTTAARGRPLVEDTVGRPVQLSAGGQSYEMTVFRIAPGEYRLTGEGADFEAHYDVVGPFERRLRLGSAASDLLVVDQGDCYLVESSKGSYRVIRGDQGTVRAPAPSLVARVLVQPGSRVEAGTPLVVIEAMKMETQITAPFAGVVAAVHVAGNMQVQVGTPLVDLRPDRPAGDDATGGRVGLFGLAPATSIPGAVPCIANMRRLRQGVLGFDVDLAQLDRELLAAGPCADSDAGGEKLLAAELETLEAFADVVALVSRRAQAAAEGEQPRSPHERLVDYLRARDSVQALGPEFRRDLVAALDHYGVCGLDPSPSLDEGLFDLFRAHRRAHEYAPAILTVLGRWLAAGPPPDLGTRMAKVLDRLSEAAAAGFPDLAQLARDVRYQHFDQPTFEAARAAAYWEMRDHLHALAGGLQTAERAIRLRRLTDCPQPLHNLLLDLAGTPERDAIVLEVLMRRYYRGPQASAPEITAAAGQASGRLSFADGRSSAVALAILAPQLETGIAEVLRQAEAAPHKRAVCDVYCYASAAPGLPDDDALSVRVLARLDAENPPAEVQRVLVSLPQEPGRPTRHLTFRRSAEGFEEDRPLRGIHPMIADRLGLWRLSEFVTERLPTADDVYLFRAIARSNPRDERLFAIAEVRDLTPELDATGAVTRLPHLERMFLEAAAAIRHALVNRPADWRPDGNRILLNVWPDVDFDPTQLEQVIARLSAAVRDLGLQKTVASVRLRRPGGELEETTFDVVEPPGSASPVVRSRAPAQEPIRPVTAYQMKAIQMRRRGHVHPFEVIRMLTSADEAGAFPRGEFQEYDLDAQGLIGLVERPPGQNQANLVIGLIRSYTDRYPEGMERAIVLGDPSRSLGALAEPECRRIVALLDLAEARGLPVEWFALSSGARISMDSGTENMDWIAAVLRRIVEFTQAGGEINVVVNGINVGAQPYWNAEATMLMHTRGILVMTPDGAMVLTGKQALDYSGGVSADDNLGIGGYERVMGPNGQAQYWAADLRSACSILLRHYEHTYRLPGERWPRPARTRDPVRRNVGRSTHSAPGSPFRRVGEIFSEKTNPGRKHAFDIRAVMAACADQDLPHLERWQDMGDAETVVTWDAFLGGNAVSLIGIESRPLPRWGGFPADGPEQWTAGTLFPMSSKKLARSLNAASGRLPVVVLANLSGFDGSPESMRNLQLEFGADIGRAVVNFDGPIVFCVVSRYHGGAFVVFSNRLNSNLEVAAVEGSYASVIGGAPAAAVVFSREVDQRTNADARVKMLEASLAQAGGTERADLVKQLRQTQEEIRSEKLGEVAAEFDDIHTVGRALEVGSVHRIIAARALRPYLVDALRRGMARCSSN